MYSSSYFIGFISETTHIFILFTFIFNQHVHLIITTEKYELKTENVLPYKQQGETTMSTLKNIQ